MRPLEMRSQSSFIARLLWGLIVSLATILPAAAETFLVLDDADHVPALEGTLRWAIEQSEANPGPDNIDFAIDFAWIELVEPLPPLRDGQLTIHRASVFSAGPGPVPVYTISGGGKVPFALEIHSQKNAINGLHFTGFAGKEVILIEGKAAIKNSIVGCWFGSPDSNKGNVGAAVRYIASSAPARTEDLNRIVGCGFVFNDIGIATEGPGLDDRRSQLMIRNCWFGTDDQAKPGLGNGRVLDIQGTTVSIVNCLMSGPGRGVRFSHQANNTGIYRSHLGLSHADGTPCTGFTGPAIEVDSCRGVIIAENLIRCSEVGVSLQAGAENTAVESNRFGDADGAPRPEYAIRVAGANGSLIARNEITAAQRAGIATDSEAESPNTLSCNRIWGAVGVPISQAEPVVQPPLLKGAFPLAVEGQIQDTGPGFIELFTDAGSQAQRFLVTLHQESNTPDFRVELPIMGLTVRRSPDGSSSARIAFPDDAAMLTATYTRESLMESSALADAIASTESRPLFDLVRGDVSALAPLLAGGVDLGPLTALACAAPQSSLPFDDPDLPEAGHAFFYVSRRVSPNEPGDAASYNPGRCLDDVDDSLGERIEGPGGCN